MRWTGQIFWLLAYVSDFCQNHLLPAFTASCRNIGILPVRPADMLSADPFQQVTNLLDTDLGSMLRAERLAQLGSRIQLQQRNCSRFARDFLRRSTFPSSQRTRSRSSGLCSPLQELFRSYPARVATNRRPSPIIEPSAVSVTSCSAKA
jgi:hypothetical protein